MKPNFGIVEGRCQSKNYMWSFGNESFQDLMLDEPGINCDTLVPFLAKIWPLEYKSDHHKYGLKKKPA